VVVQADHPCAEIAVPAASIPRLCDNGRQILRSLDEPSETKAWGTYGSGFNLQLAHHVPEQYAAFSRIRHIFEGRTVDTEGRAVSALSFSRLFHHPLISRSELKDG